MIRLAAGASGFLTLVQSPSARSDMAGRLSEPAPFTLQYGTASGEAKRIGINRGHTTMAIDDLHHFAKALAEYRESQRKAGFARSDEELKLINNLLLQAVREIIALERRVAALEGKTDATRITSSVSRRR